MYEPRRNVMKRRILRQAVRVNVGDIHDVLPAGLRRSPGFSARLGRLFAAGMAIVLASGVASRLTEPSIAAPQALTRTARSSAPEVVESATDPSSVAGLANESRAPSVLSLPRPIDPSVLRLSMRRIVIDAGHGGKDPGARTPGGVAEKDISLDIARRLEVLVREDGFAVAMTRSGDETVSLRERTLRANRARGDLFLSIHVNAFPQQNRRGVETYYLGPADDARGELLARAENAESGYSIADVRTVVEGVYTNMRANDSRAFADTVQRHVYGTLRRTIPDLEDRGVRTAPFVVLVTTEMPAILAEVSCLSNEESAALLEQTDHRQRIAEALAHGIRAYADAYEQREGAGSARR